MIKLPLHLIDCISRISHWNQLSAAQTQEHDYKRDKCDEFKHKARLHRARMFCARDNVRYIILGGHNTCVSISHTRS